MWRRYRTECRIYRCAACDSPLPCDGVAGPVLVFDGDCAFCTSSVGWLERHVGKRPVIVAWQFADLDRLGLTPRQCSEALQWVGVDGRHRQGAAAVAATLRHAGRGWAVVGAVLAAPGVRWVAERVYRWVAANRHRLPGGTAACSLEGRLSAPLADAGSGPPASTEP
jgi:predicted DCC family thiol-disulfide oxidoreductase YuxK